SGAAGEDDHLAAVQARGELVELRGAGGDAGDLPAAVLGGLDGAEGLVDPPAPRHEVLAPAALGDRVDRGRRLVDGLVDLAAVGRVAELDDAGAGLDQAAQGGTLDHDLRVVAGVGGGGDHVDEVGEVGAAAHPLQLAALVELVGDGDQVGGLP